MKKKTKDRESKGTLVFTHDSWKRQKERVARLIGMNHASFLGKFSMFFITKTNDSQSFSLILCQSLILYYFIEYGNVGIKRAAKR